MVRSMVGTPKRSVVRLNTGGSQASVSAASSV